jgi:choline dehydrogenase
MGTVDEMILKHLANYKTETFRGFFPLYANLSQEGFVLLNTCLLPKSRGTIKLNSENIYSDPKIDPEFLKDKNDMKCMRNAVEMSIKLISTKAFQKFDAKILWPKLYQCSNFEPLSEVSQPPSDRYIDCLLRQGSLTAHHPQGSCAIGKVVDENLR